MAAVTSIKLSSYNITHAQYFKYQVRGSVFTRVCHEYYSVGAVNS